MNGLTAQERVQIAVAVTHIGYCLSKPYRGEEANPFFGCPAVIVMAMQDLRYIDRVIPAAKFIGSAFPKAFGDWKGLAQAMRFLDEIETVLGMEPCQRNSGLPAGENERAQEIEQRAISEFIPLDIM